MNAKKLVNLVGASVVMLSVTGFAAADVRYGEAGSEWFSDAPSQSSVRLQSVSVDDINRLNESAPAAAGKMTETSDSHAFWLAE